MDDESARRGQTRLVGETIDQYGRRDEKNVRLCAEERFGCSGGFSLSVSAWIHRGNTTSHDNTLRFHPAIQCVRRILNSGELGTIKEIYASLALPSLAFGKNDIRFNYALGGGSLMDMGCKCLFSCILTHEVLIRATLSQAILYPFLVTSLRLIPHLLLRQQLTECRLKNQTHRVLSIAV